MTKLSIVVPTYNLGSYLDKTLQTLKQQTVDFELWLVDDHSTDKTAQVAQAFTAGIPNFHTVVFDHHQGVSVARNFGIDHSTADAIAFVDGDDLVTPDYAQTLIAGFTAGVPAVAVGYEWWRPSDHESDRYETLDQRQMFDQVSRRGTAVGGYIWNKAYDRQAIEKIGLRFDERLTIAEDYLFTATFVAKTSGQYRFDPAVKYKKVNRATSTTHTRSFKDRSVENQIFNRIDEMGRYL